MDKKIKILTISDHPLSPSGVGTQTKYMITAMLKTEKYEFISLGGAIKHNDYNMVKTDEWGDLWKIIPVDGYGNPEIIRSVIRTERPDILWFMTDPRFWGWLWMIEDEIRPLTPMIYYHVWDNFPPPHFNRPYYESNDVIATISKVTDEIVKKVAPDVKRIYIPHAVDTDIFKKSSEEQTASFRKELFPNEENPDRTVFFWNNRNARRKQSGTIIFWFKEFLDMVGHDQACLTMHTDPFDPNGQNLRSITEYLELTDDQIVFSTQKVQLDQLAMFYNMADCTINISDAEGFGLATLESLSCETPIIVNMTGGLQEQVTDGENWFGVGIEPSSKAIIGSQDIPWIYEDRVSKEDFINALLKIHKMKSKEREKLGHMGREHVMKNYNFDNFSKQWDEVLTTVYNECGSWNTTRENYQSWKLITI